MPLGPDAQYLCQYNDYVLPGYVQNETFDSIMSIASRSVPYADGAFSEYLGLENKQLTVRLKVWEQNFLTCKDQVELAATYLRSKKDGYGTLYVGYDDRHYDAMTKSIKLENTAGRAVRIMEYDVVFEARPWLISNTTLTISGGTGTLTTDSVSRDINDGGWTPANLLLTGTNITVSGYTDTEPFTGYLSVTGAVTNLYIDSENYTATIAGVNNNDKMLWVDYQIMVGPEKTYFVVTGATNCIITYNNRWYI